jgi:hypothetical protein
MPQAHNIGNDSGVVGATVKDALDLLAALNGAPTGVRNVSGLLIPVLATDQTLLVTNSAAASIQLPDPATRKGALNVVCTQSPAFVANRISLVRHGAETIDGVAGTPFYLEQSFSIITDGTNWRTVSLTTRLPTQTVVTPTNLGGSTIGVLTPTDFSASQILRLASTAAILIRGLQTGAAPYPKYILNVNANAAFTLTFAHEDGSIAAASRIWCPGGVDFVLNIAANGGSAMVFYDPTSQRYILR